MKSTPGKVSYKALGTMENQQLVQFKTPAFEKETEITGHVVVHLNVSITPEVVSDDKDIDLFLTLRYIDPTGRKSTTLELQVTGYY